MLLFPPDLCQDPTPSLRHLSAWTPTCAISLHGAVPDLKAFTPGEIDSSRSYSRPDPDLRLCLLLRRSDTGLLCVPCFSGSSGVASLLEEIMAVWRRSRMMIVMLAFVSCRWQRCREELLEGVAARIIGVARSSGPTRSWCLSFVNRVRVQRPRASLRSRVSQVEHRRVKARQVDMASAAAPQLPTIEIKVRAASKLQFSRRDRRHPKLELEIFLDSSSRTSDGIASNGTPYTRIGSTYNRVHKLGSLDSFLQLTPQGAACMAASQQLLSQLGPSLRHHLVEIVAELLGGEVEKLRHHPEGMVGLKKLVVQIRADVRVTEWSSPQLDDKDDTCPVCLHGFQGSEEKVRIACSHQFHPDCIRQWMNDRNTCPVCRFQYQTPCKTLRFR